MNQSELIATIKKQRETAHDCQVKAWNDVDLKQHNYFSGYIAALDRVITMVQSHEDSALKQLMEFRDRVNNQGFTGYDFEEFNEIVKKLEGNKNGCF